MNLILKNGLPTLGVVVGIFDDDMGENPRPRVHRAFLYSYKLNDNFSAIFIKYFINTSVLLPCVNCSKNLAIFWVEGGANGGEVGGEGELEGDRNRGDISKRDAAGLVNEGVSPY